VNYIITCFVWVLFGWPAAVNRATTESSSLCAVVISSVSSPHETVCSVQPFIPVCSIIYSVFEYSPKEDGAISLAPHCLSNRKLSPLLTRATAVLPLHPVS